MHHKYERGITRNRSWTRSRRRRRISSCQHISKRNRHRESPRDQHEHRHQFIHIYIMARTSKHHRSQESELYVLPIYRCNHQLRNQHRHGTFVADSNWDTKIIVFTDVARNATIDGQKDTGNCFAALGEKCVRDYYVSLGGLITAQYFSGRNNTGTAPVIPSPPESCGYRFTNASIVSRKFHLHVYHTSLHLLTLEQPLITNSPMEAHTSIVPPPYMMSPTLYTTKRQLLEFGRS